jgi:endonuclease/exonuclease/phosphatase family metal-dependent hydrolase
MVLRFATYNIQYGVGQDGRYDLDRVIEELKDQDVICLQEVTNWIAMNGLLNFSENCSNKWALQVTAITGHFGEAQFFYLGVCYLGEGSLCW